MTTNAHMQHTTDGVVQNDPAEHAPSVSYAAPPAAPRPEYAQPRQVPGKNAYGYSIASFVLGIASIVSGWTFIAPIVGLVLGSLALKRNTPERTLALWGVWLNGIILGLAVLAVVLFITLASFGVMTGVFTGVFG